MKNPLSKDALIVAQNISHQIWEKYDDSHGYRSEKQAKNMSVSTDNPDNIWFFWNQFDIHNQKEFVMLFPKYIHDAGAVELTLFIAAVVISTAEQLAKLYEG